VGGNLALLRIMGHEKRPPQLPSAPKRVWLREIGGGDFLFGGKENETCRGAKLWRQESKPGEKKTGRCTKKHDLSQKRGKGGQETDH